MSATASYVYTHGADLQGGVGYQNVTQILPAGISTGRVARTRPFREASCVPFVDFGGGSYQATYGVSSYHGLQTKLEEQYANGLTFLLTYTWSKTMSDAGDLLNGGNTGGFAPITCLDSVPSSTMLWQTSTSAMWSISAADMNCRSEKARNI